MNKSYDIILKRSGGFCESCGRLGIQRAHIEHRKMGGRHGIFARLIDDPRNSAWLCADCHGLIDGRRKEWFEHERLLALTVIKGRIGWFAWALEATSKGLVIALKQGI